MNLNKSELETKLRALSDGHLFGHLEQIKIRQQRNPGVMGASCLFVVVLVAGLFLLVCCQVSTVLETQKDVLLRIGSVSMGIKVVVQLTFSTSVFRSRLIA